MSSDTPSSDWRTDPSWRLVVLDPALHGKADLLATPTAEAELANPPVWSSLYDGNKIVATWWRPVIPTEPRATVVVDEKQLEHGNSDAEPDGSDNQNE